MWFALSTGVLIASTTICTAALIVTRRHLTVVLKNQEALERSSLVLGEERRVLELIAHGASLPVRVADALQDETVERAMIGVIVALETPATEPPTASA
jgi:hypothetical protein